MFSKIFSLCIPITKYLNCYIIILFTHLIQFVRFSYMFLYLIYFYRFSFWTYVHLLFFTLQCYHFYNTTYLNPPHINYSLLSCFNINYILQLYNVIFVYQVLSKKNSLLEIIIITLNFQLFIVKWKLYFVTALSKDQLQSLLELVCFYNAEDKTDEEWIEERWFKQGVKDRNILRKTWKYV